jgi:hypothetical protein
MLGGGDVPMHTTYVNEGYKLLLMSKNYKNVGMVVLDTLLVLCKFL